MELVRPRSMIITQTPFRISFFGGGTDYPDYFEKNGGGAVLGTAIDHSAYLSVSHFYSKLFDYSIRIAYRKVECVKTLDEIEHAPFRECLRHCGISTDVEINYTGELPSYSGLGSSSSFVVGLLNALHAFEGRTRRPIDLAIEAILLEQDTLKEAVGCQDQVFAAVGGFKLIEFRTREDIVVHAVPMKPEKIRLLEDHLLLLHTGIKRRAAAVATRYIKRLDEQRTPLLRLRQMVDEGYSVLTSCSSFTKIGELLDEAWQLKRSLDAAISNPEIEAVYKQGIEAGAIGGKLLGAGGGGCMLFFVPPERREKVRESLPHLEEIPICINSPGSHIIHA
jgi:D-glycero-alpha-D-manno-heptose-7-phosphate kinase